MRKKLLFVITKSNWGGAGRYVFDLAVALSPKYDVAVALGGDGPLIAKLHNSGIRTIPIASLGRDIRATDDSAAFFALLDIFRKEKPDIVHLNSSKAGGLGALAARFARVPQIIYTAHGWAYNEPVPVFSRFFRWGASLLTLLLSHRVITVSDFDRVHSPLGLKTMTVHNGLEVPAFLEPSEARREIVRKAHVPEDAFVIGTIAELHKNKGIDLLITAFAKIKNGHLVIVGEGEDRAELEALIKRLELGGRVHLAGFVDNAATLLKGFDIFVLASRKEGLPYVILEAGEAGVPVIASTVGGIPEIIDDQLSGILVPAYDTDALAEAIDELQASPQTRAHYTERLKEKVSRYFGLRGMIKKTVEAYEQ
ncbi:glycosyltransferase family 4 protein [Candidatus Kaiserbacteria bacterium]|nr:glycosyltransferase family 4 protein [Candidatus Kaiserbacteria bacterium]